MPPIRMHSKRPMLQWEIAFLKYKLKLYISIPLRSTKPGALKTIPRNGASNTTKVWALLQPKKPKNTFPIYKEIVFILKSWTMAISLICALTKNVSQTANSGFPAMYQAHTWTLLSPRCPTKTLSIKNTLSWPFKVIYAVSPT